MSTLIALGYELGLVGAGVVLLVLGLVYSRTIKKRGAAARPPATARPDRTERERPSAAALTEPVDTEPAPVAVVPAPAPPIPNPVSTPPPRTIMLSEIVHEMIEGGVGDRTAFLNRETLEVIQLTEDQVTALENDYAAEHGGAEVDARLRRQYDAGELIELPSKYETQEFSLRERFCDELSSDDHAEQLRKALRAGQAFREFDQTAGRLGVKDQWEHYRERAFEEMAVDWLESNDVPYDRGRAAA